MSTRLVVICTNLFVNPSRASAPVRGRALSAFEIVHSKHPPLKSRADTDNSDLLLLLLPMLVAVRFDKRNHRVSLHRLCLLDFCSLTIFTPLVRVLRPAGVVRLDRCSCAVRSNTLRFCLRVQFQPDKTVTWLILPVVICLSQRLSHACLSINNFIL